MFILTDQGTYISVHAVMEVSHATHGPGVHIRLLNGREYNASFENWHEGSACWQVLPAEPGTYLLFYHPDSDGGGESVCREKVIAWACHRDGLTEPVAAHGRYRADGVVPTVLNPDGTVQDFDSVWPSYDQWLAEMRETRAGPIEAGVSRASVH